MEEQQDLEWAEAQKIAISTELVAAAKQQLRFLAEVDRHRYLYDGPALERAIYRYKYCWLPLLAKHTKPPVPNSPLVVPLDCEWIWHCHRLNPVRYRNDCKELFGRTLGTWNVVSSTQTVCREATKELWNRMYPHEPYELNTSTHVFKSVGEEILRAQKSTQYDLVSAVKRQSSFYYQASSPHMKDDVFLEEAVARYKGFLYLIKSNQERSIRRFCVPTYDIDLIWHSHQLHPVSYCKDLTAIIGRVLEHDDTDSDRTEGKKLDVGFSGTTKQWEETFGSRYWKSGAMHRGSAPSPLTINLSEVTTLNKNGVGFNEYQSVTHLPRKKLVEVMVEIVGVRDLPARHRGSLSVTLSKKQLDLNFNGRRMSILSEAGEKDVAVFQSEPTGDLIFELVSYSPSVLHIARPAKMLGRTSISLQDLMKPSSPLSTEKWFELLPDSGIVVSKPINLRIALSFTPPVDAPFLLQMVRAHPCTASCFFPLGERFQRAKKWTCIVDEDGNDVITLQIRDPMQARTKKEVIGMTKSGETHVLAAFDGKGWSLMNSNWWFKPRNKITDVGHIYELIGSQRVIIVPGRKLEYEINCEKHKNEQNFMTAVKYSAEYPYGKAVALFDLKSASLKINEEWLVFPGILLAFVLSDNARNEKHGQFSATGESKKEINHASKQNTNNSNKEDKAANKINDVADATKLIPEGAHECVGESAGCCNCGVVVQVEDSARDGKGNKNYGNGSTAITESTLCAGCVAQVGSHHNLGDIAKSPHCGGCSSCHGGCGGCGSCHGSGCGGGGCGGGRSHSALP